MGRTRLSPRQGGRPQLGAGIAAAILLGALSTTFLAGCRVTDRFTVAESNHAMSGVVRSVDAMRLIIARTGKHPGEMTFVLSPSTQREGPIGVGATVQVRFRTEGQTQVATAILATPSKRPAAGGNAP